MCFCEELFVFVIFWSLYWCVSIRLKVLDVDWVKCCVFVCKEESYGVFDVVVLIAFDIFKDFIVNYEYVFCC